MKIDMNRLYRTLEGDEGFRNKPYLCTAKKLTIGIGRNLEDVGISYSEAKFMLKNDVNECIDDLKNIFKNFDDLPGHIQEVLINMRFNLGPNRFRGFKKMIGAVNGWDFERMIAEMRNSTWYKQVTNRADRLIDIVLNGHKEKYR